MDLDTPTDARPLLESFRCLLGQNVNYFQMYVMENLCRFLSIARRVNSVIIRQRMLIFFRNVDLLFSPVREAFESWRR